MNGRLNTDELMLVDGWAYLTHNTGRAWIAACNEMVALGHPRPTITAPDGAYRTYARQVYWKNHWTARGLPLNAATPGYSNHGWGTAVDIFEYWLWPYQVRREVFGKWGFTFNVPSEPWHMQHNNIAPAGGDFTPIEDEMSKAAEEAIFQIRDVLGAKGGLNTETGQSVAYLVRDMSAALTAALPAQAARDTKLLNYLVDGGENVANTIGDPGSVFGRVIGLQAQVVGLTEAVKALAVGQGVDPVAIEEAAQRGAAKALENVQLAVIKD